MLEAALLLLVFVPLLLGVMFLGQLYLASASARAEARSCTWRYAVDGCRKIPEGCGDVLGSPREVDDEHGAEVDGALRSDLSSQAGAKPETLGVLDRAIASLVGRSVQGTALREVRWSPGRRSSADSTNTGKSVQVRGHFAVLCNTDPPDPKAAIEEAFCAINPLCGD